MNIQGHISRLFALGMTMFLLFHACDGADDGSKTVGSVMVQARDVTERGLDSRSGRGADVSGVKAGGSGEGVSCIDTGRQTGPGCDMEGVMRAVRREAGPGRGIQACYLREVGKPAEGRLTMVFSLSPDGHAEKLVARQDDFAHTGLAGCVAGVLGRIQYPAPGDVPCQVVYPFTFSAGEKR